MGAVPQNKANNRSAASRGSSGRKKNKGKVTTPPPRPAQRAPQGGKLTATGVPPLDAFDKMPKRSPPNIPGQPGYRDPLAGNAPPPAKRSAKKKPQGQGKRTAGAGKQAQGKRTAATGKQSRTSRSVNPSRRRKRSRRLSGTILLVCIVAIIGFLGAILLKIDTIVVEGESPYTDEEITAMFNAEEGDNLLLSFNAKKEGQNLQERLPYLQEARVHRRPLNTVVIKVSEAVPKYYLYYDKQYVILSDVLKVLQISETRPEGLVRIRGVEEASVVPGQLFAITDEEQAQSFAALREALARHGIVAVSDIDVADTLGMSFVWDNRFTIVVGSRNNIDAKLEYVFVLINDTSQSRFTSADKGTIDVSGYPGTPNAIYSPE